MARCVPPVFLALIAALCLASCGFLGRPERPVWRAQAENACFARQQVTLSDTIVAGARNRRAGHLRHDPSAESLGARQRRDRHRQDPDHRLSDDPGARGLAQRHRRARRADPLRAEGRDRQRVRRL